MKTSTVGNRMSVRVLLLLSVVATLVLVMNHATPAQSQQPATVRVSNLGHPVPVKYPSFIYNTFLNYTHIESEQSYAQSFCTGSVAATLGKVRLYTRSLTPSPTGCPTAGTPTTARSRSRSPW